MGSKFLCACEGAGNDSGWKIGDIGEEKVTLVVGLVFEYLIPKMTIL